MGGGRAGARSILLLAGTSSLAQPAHAGAWALAEGVSQWFATVSRDSGDFGQVWRADDFTEYGLGGGWALNAKVETEVRFNELYDERSGYQLGILKAFALSDRASFSVRAAAIGGESLLQLDECQGSGYEARAAIGTSFSLFGREGFVNAEAGRRTRGDCNRDLMELAAGLEFAPEWNLILKGWSEKGGETESTKAEASISREFGMFSVGAGWREEISGEFEEKGWVLSLQAAF